MEKQLWSKQDIEEIVSQYSTKQGGSIGSFSVPLHRHNGSDSLKLIPADSLMGFPTILTTDATIAPVDTPPAGTFRFYFDTVPLYYLWAFINNTWVSVQLT